MRHMSVQDRARIAQRHIAKTAIDLVCDAYEVSPTLVLAAGRSQAHISLARQVAIYIAHVVGQLNLTQLSEEFNRDRSTVSHACHIVEDRRDSILFDKQMSFLEKEYDRQLMELYRNWLSESSYYKSQITNTG